MKIILKNSTLTFAKGKWSNSGVVIKVNGNISNVNLPTGVSCNVVGRNLVDINALKYHKILNDTGQEVADTSSYFDQFIPVLGGCVLRSNLKINRVYLYDKDKNFISRLMSNSYQVDVPDIYNSKEVWWVKIQTEGTSSITPINTMIVTRDEDVQPEFAVYKYNNTGEIYSPYSWVYADDLREITISKK